jgi:hypothetical protein
MRNPKINLITEPDTLFTNDPSVLLVNPNNQIKESLNDVLKNITDDLNLYLFEEDVHSNLEWLVNVSRSVDYIVLNIDDSTDLGWIIGYFLGMNKTFYLTNNEQIQYNVVNVNKIYDIHQFAEGVKYFEK